MGTSSSPDLKRLLPLVALATFYVALAPILVVWELGASGIVSSPVLSVVGVLVLSLAMSSAGAAWWKQREGSEDVLFGDLIAWNWIRRRRIEGRLDEATSLLGLAQEEHATPARQAELLQVLTSALEARDPYTHGHSRRVARFSVLIAKRMGLPEEMVASVRAAAAVHDVGKISVPRAVLNKPGKLTEQEFARIKRHAEDSARMVRGLDDGQITAIVRHHHERLDGTGYPDGLSGEDVPVGSRIIAVADTFDALTSKRPYRNSNSHKTAMNTLASEAGTHLDPDAVRAFASCYSGRRALTLWNGLTLLSERVLSALSAGLNAGGAASSTPLLAAAAAATTLIGGSVVLSTTPPTSAAYGASPKTVTVATVDASVPGARRGSLVSIPALITADPSVSSNPRHTSASPGSASNGSSGARPAPRRPPGLGTSPPSGAATGGSGSNSSTTGGASGGASGSSPGAGGMPDVPGGGGDLPPTLPAPGGPLPSAPSDSSLLPDVSGAGGGLLPSSPPGGGLLPQASGGFTIGQVVK